MKTKALLLAVLGVVSMWSGAGVARAATVSGTVTYSGTQTGKVFVTAAQIVPGNQVLNLDGSGDSVRTPLTSLAGSELTIQYWFRGSSMQSAVRQQSGGWVIAGWNGLHILSHDGGVGGISAGNGITDGQWHHVAMTWKQGTVGGFASYLDGQLVTSRDSVNAPIPDHGAAVYFGSFNGIGEFTSGQLDEIAIWSKALTAAEIQANWRQRLTGAETGLTGYWNFDDGTATDLTGHGFDGTFIGDAGIVAADIAGLGGAIARVEIPAPGAYHIPGLPLGPNYHVTAFRDANNNNGQDRYEPFGAHAGNPFELTGDASGIDVDLLEGPRITTQPSSRRVALGSDTTISVTAAGTDPLTYQWRKNGVPIDDPFGVKFVGIGTSDLQIRAATTAEEGIYTVAVSNALDFVVSQGASLEVVEGGADVSGTVSYSGSQTGRVMVALTRPKAGNRALQLDGSGDYVRTSLTDLSGPELTIQYWFKGSSIQSAVRQQSGGWVIVGWNNLSILSHDGGVNGISLGNNVTDGQWHHVAMTWKQGTVGGFATYLDGQLVARRDSANAPIPNHRVAVFFGAFNGVGEFMNGQLDEIAIWNKALSAAEVVVQSQAVLRGTEDGLIGFWNFDDGTATDLTGHGYNGTLSGDATTVATEIPGLGGRFTTQMPAPGPYTISLVPTNDGYFASAFRDVNGNGKRDTGEPVGAYAGNPFLLLTTINRVNITLLDPPFITQQPQGMIVCGGDSFAMKVTATGTAPLSYQWRHNGADLTDGGNISGATTAELHVSNASGGDEGIYTVRIGNAVDQIVSGAASLGVATGGLADRLIGYWKFDETLGPIAVDSSGAGNDGALNNYPGHDSQWVAGQIGGALSFGGPGASQYVLVPDYPKPTSTMSVSVWVWANSRPTWASIVKNWGDSQSGQVHFGLFANAGDLSNFLTTQGGANPNTRENFAFPLNSWQHVAFVANGATLRVFRNGVQVGPAASYDGTLLSTPPMSSLAIGVKTGNSGLRPDASNPGYWHGMMDDLGIWSRSLSDDEIPATYQGGLTGHSIEELGNNAPKLTIVRSGGNARLSWPSPSCGFVLESAGSLPSAIWSPVAGTPTVVGGAYSLNTTIGAGNEFFRLRKM